MNRRGKEFENDIRDIFSSLLPPTYHVKQNDKIRGLKSGLLREFDLSIRGCEFLAVVEAKDHKRPVDIKTVEQFLGMASDIRANALMMVAGSDFTHGARKRAVSDEVQLLTVIDPSGLHRWHQPFTADCLLLVTLADLLTLRVNDSLYPGQDALCLKIYDFQYNLLGTVYDVMFELNLPLFDGSLINEPLLDQSVLIEDPAALGGFREVMLTATLQIRTESWLGPIRLLQGRGLFDEINGLAFLPSENSTFEHVDPGRLRTNPDWHRIQLTDELLRKTLQIRFTGIACDFE